MPFPIQFNVFNQNIPLHLVLETAAFYIGYRYFLYLKKKQGDPIPTSNRIWILIGAIFGALLGSRLIGSLERPLELAQTANKFWYIVNNKTVLGGFLGGLFGVELAKKIIGEAKSSGDLFTYPMILALIIGRVGCFSMGVYEETYGTPTQWFTGMDLGDGILRHPVTLYEIAFLLLLWLALKRLERHHLLEEGARFKLFMIGYLIFRFVLDFIKPSYLVVAGLSTIQLTSLLGLLYYYRYLVQPKKLFANFA